MRKYLVWMMGASVEGRPDERLDALGVVADSPMMAACRASMALQADGRFAVTFPAPIDGCWPVFTFWVGVPASVQAQRTAAVDGAIGATLKGGAL